MISSISKRLNLTPDRRRKVWYAPVLVVGLALMMVRLLVMARLLSIEEFGSFSVGLLVSNTFSMLGCLGLQTMLQRDAPIMFMRGEERKVAILTIQSCIVAIFLCVAGLLLIGVGESLVEIDGVVLALGIVHGFSQQIFAISTVESRSKGDVLRYSRQSLSRSTILLVAIVIAALGTESAVVILVVEAACTLVLSTYFLGFIRSSADGIIELLTRALEKLPTLEWTVALTLLGSSMYAILLSNGDRWMAAGFLGLPEFAVYAFGWIVLAMSQHAQAVINAAVFPLVARRFSKFGRRRAFTVCVSISGGIALMAIVFCLPVYFVLKYAIEAWYPAYVDVVAILPIFLIIATLRLSDFWTTFLLVCGMEKKHILFNSMSLVLSLIVILVFYLAGNLKKIGIFEIAYLALVINLIFVGTTAVVSWKNRDCSAG